MFNILTKATRVPTPSPAPGPFLKRELTIEMGSGIYQETRKVAIAALFQIPKHGRPTIRLLIVNHDIVIQKNHVCNEDD